MTAESRFAFERLHRLAQIERWHFWFAGRHRLVESMLETFLPGKRLAVLDIGCGTGSMLERLRQRGYCGTGLDMRPEGLGAARQVVSEARVLQADAAQLPIVARSFDAALMLDVLEHVDDRAALAEVARVLRPGGWVIITVPALPWLWSARDDAAGHLRRYTRRHFTAVLEEAQLEIRALHYYQCLLLPLVIIARWLGRRDPSWRDVEDLPSPTVNRVLTWASRLEFALSRVVRWPCGSSLIAACRTPDDRREPLC